MKLFTNIFIAWKPLTIFAKSFILDNWLGSRNATGISKVTSYKCTRKENTYAKMQSKYCQSGIESCVMQKLVQPNNLNIYYEIFGEKAVFKFLRRHAWQRHSYQVYSLLLGTLLMKNVIKDIFLRPTWDCNFYPTRGTTVISCPLSYHVYCAVIPHQYK